MSEEEKKFFFKNRKGKIIFTPVYKKYREYLFDDVINNTKIITEYEALKDTAIYERYMLNAIQFAAAKSVAEGKMLQAAVFDDEKKVKSWPKFRDDAEQITNISNEVWLRVERDTCVRSCTMGEQFRHMDADKDLYPYWVWAGAMDARERPEHVEMEGKVFRIGDPEGDSCYPPAEDNCRCDGQACDDDYLAEKGLKVSTPDEVSDYLENNINERFRYNPGTQGPMPNTGSYFDAMHNANAGNANLFDLLDPDDDEELTGLSSYFRLATGLHYIVATVDEWRDKYDTDKAGDIVFRNKALYANVRFTANAIHAIQKHARGFENIPATISHPDEVWSSWEDPKKQRVTLRNYIKFGKVSFVVQTRDGILTDAFAVPKGNINKYRKGVVL